MTGTLLRRAVLSALIATVAGSASAHVRIATYTGTLDSGFDETGVFGTPSADLAGHAYSVSYTYDPTNGFRETTASYDEVEGGTEYDAASPILDVALTIAGVTRHTGPAYFARLSSRNTGTGYNLVFHRMFEFDLDDRRIALNGVSSDCGFAGERLSLDAGVRSTPCTGGISFAIGKFAPIGTIGDPQAYGSAFDSAMTYSVAAVPEPASWALLIAGFAATGAAARRRRSVPVFAA